jgi:hypothetical protein
MPSMMFDFLIGEQRVVKSRGSYDLGSILIVISSWRWDDEGKGVQQERLWTPTAALPVGVTRNPAGTPV